MDSLGLEELLFKRVYSMLVQRTVDRLKSSEFTIWDFIVEIKQYLEAALIDSRIAFGPVKPDRIEERLEYFGVARRVSGHHFTTRKLDEDHSVGP